MSPEHSGSNPFSYGYNPADTFYGQQDDGEAELAAICDSSGNLPSQSQFVNAFRYCQKVVDSIQLDLVAWSTWHLQETESCLGELASDLEDSCIAELTQISSDLSAVLHEVACHISSSLGAIAEELEILASQLGVPLSTSSQQVSLSEVGGVPAIEIPQITPTTQPSQPPIDVYYPPTVTPIQPVTLAQPGKPIVYQDLKSFITAVLKENGVNTSAANDNPALVDELSRSINISSLLPDINTTGVEDV